MITYRIAQLEAELAGAVIFWEAAHEQADQLALLLREAIAFVETSHRYGFTCNFCGSQSGTLERNRHREGCIVLRATAALDASPIATSGRERGT